MTVEELRDMVDTHMTDATEHKGLEAEVLQEMYLQPEQGSSSVVAIPLWA